MYAHLDVQPPDPLELWESDPWSLVERDGKLVARGVADDKAHLFMLLKATELLAAAGELPVNVRFAIDAEEEIGGHSIVEWVEEDTGPADAALVLDGAYETETLPGFCTALRGICYFHVTVRTGERDLHSGMYGGAALTATHASAGDSRCRAARPRREARRAAARGHRPADRRGGRRVGASCLTGARSSSARAPGRWTASLRTSSGGGRRPSPR